MTGSYHITPLYPAVLMESLPTLKALIEGYASFVAQAACSQFCFGG